MILPLALEYKLTNRLSREFKAGRTDLDNDVVYIGLSQEDFANNPYQLITTPSWTIWIELPILSSLS